MAEPLNNPNNASTNGSSFWNDTVNNLTKLFDSGVQVYQSVINKANGKPASTPATAATPPGNTILGLPERQFYATAAIAAGALVLLLVLKKR